MKRDLKRHKLLKILADIRVKFEAQQLSENEHLGVSFDELTKKMNCDIIKLNLIASELYDNKEIKHHNAHGIYGLFCEKEGLTSFANNKYKARYLRDIWTNLFTISQIIVPILALVIALVTVLDSRQSKERIEEIQLLRKELYKLQVQQDSQTNKILNLESILKTDSLYEK
jgi:hypothetical protein